MRIHLQTPTLHCRDALSVRNFSNFQAAFDLTNWDHQLIARNPPEPHWRETMNHGIQWLPCVSEKMPFSSCIPNSQKFLRNDLESSYLNIFEPLLMNQGITYGRMLREWGDSIPMLPDMPVDDSWKIPGTPGQGSDRPRKSWFPVMKCDEWIGFVCFFSRKIRK